MVWGLCFRSCAVLVWLRRRPIVGAWGRLRAGRRARGAVCLVWWRRLAGGRVARLFVVVRLRCGRVRAG